MEYVCATLNMSEKEKRNVMSRPRTFVPFVCEGQRIIWGGVPFGRDDEEPADA